MNFTIKRRTIIPFYVIIEDINRRDFVKYDIMDYLVNCYKETRRKEQPTTREEFVEFVERKSHYMYESRTEYEIILGSLCGFSEDKKIDVHFQIMNNIGIVVEILMKNVNKL